MPPKDYINEWVNLDPTGGNPVAGLVSGAVEGIGNLFIKLFTPPSPSEAEVLEKKTREGRKVAWDRFNNGKMNVEDDLLGIDDDTIKALNGTNVFTRILEIKKYGMSASGWKTSGRRRLEELARVIFENKPQSEIMGQRDLARKHGVSDTLIDKIMQSAVAPIQSGGKESGGKGTEKTVVAESKPALPIKWIIIAIVGFVVIFVIYKFIKK